MYFLANFVKFLTTPFFTEHLRWLRLQLYIFMEHISVAASVRMRELKETILFKNKNHLRQQFTACELL